MASAQFKQTKNQKKHKKAKKTVVQLTSVPLLGFRAHLSIALHCG
jgi:hypothetical protein